MQVANGDLPAQRDAHRTGGGCDVHGIAVAGQGSATGTIGHGRPMRTVIPITASAHPMALLLGRGKGGDQQAEQQHGQNAQVWDPVGAHSKMGHRTIALSGSIGMQG